MKKIVVLCCLISMISLTATSQMLRFGLKAGVNFSNYTGGDLGNFDFKTVTSFHGGAVVELKLLERLSIQPEVLYSTQGSELNYLDQQIKNELGYISIPVMAKTYLIKDTFNLQLGPQMSFLVSERGDVTVGDGNTFDFAIAGGAEVFLTKHLFLQGRYTLGLTEAKKNADVKNSVIQCSLGYMF